MAYVIGICEYSLLYALGVESNASLNLRQKYGKSENPHISDISPVENDEVASSHLAYLRRAPFMYSVGVQFKYLRIARFMYDISLPHISRNFSSPSARFSGLRMRWHASESHSGILPGNADANTFFICQYKFIKNL